MTTVYVSSTYSDLITHREAVVHMLRQLRYDVRAMEVYVATDERPVDECLADVAACDMYIGLFAWRYGYIPPSQHNPARLSITELEYRKASEIGIDRLIFLVNAQFAWPPHHMDNVSGEGEHGQRLAALRQ